MDFSSILRMLEKNPEAKATLEKSLGREMTALPPGRGTIELPGNTTGVIENNLAEHPYASPPPERPLLGEGKGNMTPIELPAAQLEETGAMGQGTPADSPEALSSLPEPQPELPAAPQETAPGSNPSLDQFGADSPFEPNPHEPMTSEVPPSNEAASSGPSFGKKVAIGATGLGVLGGGYQLMQGNQAHPMSTPPGNPDHPLTNMSVDPHTLMADIGGRDGTYLPTTSVTAGTAAGSRTTGHSSHGITPNVTDQHLQDALNFGSSHEQAAALQEVKNRQSMAELASGLGRAGSIIGAGFARVPVSKEALAAFDEQGKQAGTITSDYIAAQEHDPKSQQSMALRGVLDKLGVKYNGEPTAAQLKQALPYIFKDQEAKQAQANHKEEIRMRTADHALAFKDLQFRKQQAAQAKQEADDEKEIAKMGDKMNHLTASSRSVLGQAAKAKLQADRMTQVLSMNEDPNPAQYEASIIDLNGALGGPNTEGTLKGLQYDNIKTKWARLVQKYGSGISGVHTPEVKQQMLDIAKEMRAISNHVIDKNAHFIKSAHPGLMNRRPEVFDNMLSALSDDEPTPSGVPTSIPRAGQTSPGSDNSAPPSSGGPSAPSWAIK